MGIEVKGHCKVKVDVNLCKLDVTAQYARIIMTYFNRLNMFIISIPTCFKVMRTSVVIGKSDGGHL